MKENKFLIITTTFNREKEIFNTINSVINQTYKNWEMIIVKDNPKLEYVELKSYIKDRNNITLLENVENLGNNGSKNRALDQTLENIDYVVILDDDDWFNENTLKIANETINRNPKYNWFVSNRALENNEKITKVKKKKNIFSYMRDVIILKRFTGDATHFISLKKYKDIRYSKKVKLTEEWFYFCQLKEPFFYYNFNSTYQNPHQASNMTTFYNKNKIIRIKNLFILFRELLSLKEYTFDIWSIIYIPIKILAIILK